MPPRLARKPLNTYHHGDLRDALVQAALLEAEQGGPEAISIKALAKKLGVSQPAPYRHFADREALLEAVTAEAFRQFSATLRRVDRKAVEALQIVAPRAGHARVRPSPQRDLPLDVRLANHGLCAKRQRASQRGDGNLRPVAGGAGSSCRRIDTRAARVADLGRAARRGHAGGAGAAHRPSCSA